MAYEQDKGPVTCKIWFGDTKNENPLLLSDQIINLKIAFLLAPNTSETNEFESN